MYSCIYKNSNDGCYGNYMYHCWLMIPELCHHSLCLHMHLTRSNWNVYVWLSHKALFYGLFLAVQSDKPACTCTSTSNPSITLNLRLCLKLWIGSFSFQCFIWTMHWALITHEAFITHLPTDRWSVYRSSCAIVVEERIVHRLIWTL